jgi:hypothetical protein
MHSSLEDPPDRESARRRPAPLRTVVCDFPEALPVTEDEQDLLLRVLGPDLEELVTDDETK